MNTNSFYSETSRRLRLQNDKIYGKYKNEFLYYIYMPIVIYYYYCIGFKGNKNNNLTTLVRVSIFHSL